jgi:hypothetical protein
MSRDKNPEQNYGIKVGTKSLECVAEFGNGEIKMTNQNSIHGEINSRWKSWDVWYQSV